MFTGISRHHLRLVLAEVGPAWVAGREGRLHEHRGGHRRRAAGAGRPLELRLGDRVVITLVHLRTGLSHDALAVAFGVDRSTVTRAIGQVRPLLAGRGFATTHGVRLRTLADVLAYAAAEADAARGRHRDQGPPSAGGPGRTQGVRVGKRPARTRSKAP